MLGIGSIEVEGEDNGPSFILKAHFVTKMLHEENASAPRFVQILRRGWVWQLVKVEPFAFIGNGEVENIVVYFELQCDVFAGVFPVAMDNGIIHGFRYGDHDIAVDVVVQGELLLGIVNKAFHDPYVLR